MKRFKLLVEIKEGVHLEATIRTDRTIKELIQEEEFKDFKILKEEYIPNLTHEVPNEVE